MATDNFDLQGWMRENKQGAFNRKAINENIAGFTAYNPINRLKESEEEDEMDESYMEENTGHELADKWDMMPGETKEEMLDSVDFSEEGLADYAYMGWKMIPEEVRELIADKVAKASVSLPDEDEDEKIAAMAMKQAKKGAKAVKGLNPEKDIHDLLYGDDEDDDMY
jgi:hypothetical protein